ncbi:MAG: hypothetical protein G01um101466_168, partial [Parcubacteria group bacterium Gr01-1014_66]
MNVNILWLKKAICLCGILLFALHASAAISFSSAGWEQRSKISIDTTSNEQFATLELPSDFFTHLKPDLGDLRVVSGAQEIPYALITEQTQDTFHVLPARIFDLSSIAGKTTSFIIDLGTSGDFHNAITIDTPSENFRRIITIEGSRDRVQWWMLQSRAQIFDYTVRDINPVSIEDTRIAYPDATTRYLRVTIHDNGEAPLKIQGARVGRQISALTREIVYGPSFSQQENQKDKATELILDLGVTGIPHHKVRIHTPAKNFHRAVGIYEQNNTGQWQLLTNGYIFAIDTDKFQGENLILQYPESRSRMLKISIFNRDDHAIAIENVGLFGVARSVLFPYEPDGIYYAYLGNPDAKRAQYDITFLSQYIDRKKVAGAVASPIDKNPDF